MFAYSMREKTHAHRALVDDVPEEVKQRRLREVIDAFNAGARAANDREVGAVHHVLVEGVSRKSDAEWVGRTETNKRVVFARRPLPGLPTRDAAPAVAEVRPGDYVAVRVLEALSANTLRAAPLARCSIAAFAQASFAEVGRVRGARCAPGGGS